MVITWIGYCLLVSALLGLAAYASERALGHFRKPVRWVWFAAIAGSTAVPLVALFAPGLLLGGAPSSATPGVGLGELVATAAGPAAPAPVAGADAAGGVDIAAVSTVLGWVWVLLVAAMALHLARAYRRLRAEMRTWTPGELEGSPVMMSEDRGPAVVGVGGSVVVMPRWISELDDRLLRLVFLHEREHQRAGDHRLFAAGIAVLVLMPWNLCLWWQVSRLRLAIEFDCDRRVLARGASPRDYADALLAVGSRVSAPLLAAAAFAERKPAVERRLRRMTEPLARLRVTRTLGASGLAALAIILVLGAPRPETAMDGTEAPTTSLTPPSDVVEWTPAPVPDRAEIDAADGPVFIPYDMDPVLSNGADVMRALTDAYPADMKAAGVGGSVELWVYIDETGIARRSEVKTTSGSDALDRAAMEVAAVMRFTPAMNRDQPTAVWVSQTITFQVAQESAEARSEASAEDAPTFIPYDIDPILQNSGEVQRAMQEAYPRDLRDAGVGGTVEMWVFVDESGAVANRQVKTSSGVYALDRAAAEVADAMRFTPAKNEDQPTGVWVSQSFTFQVVNGSSRQDEGSPEADGPSLDLPELDLAELDIGYIRVSGLVGDVPTVERVPATEGTMDPLIVIDGVIQSLEVGMSNLEALDIVHVEVIKGDAAIRLYGERAKNGVVDITTKKKD